MKARGRGCDGCLQCFFKSHFPFHKCLHLIDLLAEVWPFLHRKMATEKNTGCLRELFFIINHAKSLACPLHLCPRRGTPLASLSPWYFCSLTPSVLPLLPLPRCHGHCPCLLPRPLCPEPCLVQRQNLVPVTIACCLGRN